MQVASRAPGQGLVKRRAVLVNPSAESGVQPVVVKMVKTEPPAPSALPLPVMEGPAYDPVVLAGDVIERLKVDPEVVETRRRLIRGVVVVVLCIVATIILNRLSPWSFRADVPAEMSPAAASPRAPHTKKENNVIGLIRSEQNPAAGAADMPNTIVFEGVAQRGPEVAGEAPDAKPKPIRIVVPTEQTPR